MYSKHPKDDFDDHLKQTKQFYQSLHEYCVIYTYELKYILTQKEVQI